MFQRVVPVVIAIAMAASIASADTTPPPDAKPDAPPGMTNPDEPKIWLFTMGIGSLIWERHGHIALCVEYPSQRRSDCYNYGVGDFHDPLTMVWGFFRGTHSFWVAKMPPQQMFAVYVQFDRTIWRQEIPLTAEQKQKVIAKLEDDILEEHKYYAYDHFEDNCTTRIRNIFDDVTHGAMTEMTNEPTDGKTFRDLARDGFFGMDDHSKISLLITDIAMGRSTDRVPNYYERMFLPQYLREAVEKKWGVKAKQVYTRSECRENPDEFCNSRGIRGEPEGPSGRWLFALFAIVITAPAVLARRFGRFQRATLALAVVPYALLGAILLFLAIISPLPYVRWNESVLVFFPVDVMLMRASWRHREIYAKGRVAMLGLFALLLAIGVFTQPLWPELLWPLIPAAVVGFWPAAWTRVTEAPAKIEPAKKSPAARNKSKRN
ncbi:MAG TPA: DUF4105 domain-containing protein [Kofleriaceae bacterium]|nr:DUF4105 domain-containing protein [Kofleriaceae bacterium]